MGWNQAYARLSQRDVQDLNQASEQLVGAFRTIEAMRPNWAPAVLQNLLAANQVVVRVQNKGAAAIARYLEKHGLKEAPGAAEAAGAEDDPGQLRNAEPEEA